jgi:hypothetical protein
MKTLFLVCHGEFCVSSQISSHGKEERILSLILFIRIPVSWHWDFHMNFGETQHLVCNTTQSVIYTLQLPILSSSHLSPTALITPEADIRQFQAPMSWSLFKLANPNELGLISPPHSFLPIPCPCFPLTPLPARPCAFFCGPAEHDIHLLLEP